MTPFRKRSGFFIAPRSFRTPSTSCSVPALTAELSLLASEAAVEEKLGHRYRRVRDLADDPEVPRDAYVSTEAIGGAEGALIGGLMYVGAAVGPAPSWPPEAP